MRHPLPLLPLLLTLAAASTAGAAEPPALFSQQQLTPETALVAARAALAHCRQAGHQVAVAVVDRSGLVQVLLRDRFAGAHTLDIAPRKAWTAASFRISTASLAAETQAGKPMSGIRQSAQVMAIGGGQVIEAAGAVVGAIGVSGAPGGEADDACALAGVKAVTELIELHD
ncbi:MULTISPECIES: GlcG/HbpS family heme-binding protein [Roseateles]|uniref:Heme-binding protein n=1 Tax=Pelomonas caseinilytica TaxID=2906763 RepID=A0ABS8XMW0_9BURK|nr:MULTISPECIES: heme-binding protein [unclassified Roseateles]MCE4540423.1 heme-binding protein [Pelomonas sp. P7]HEV6967689.1 heme-binding protein [Roseateles sp.]